MLLVKQEVVFQGRVLLLPYLEHPYLFLPYHFLLNREAAERTLTLTLFEESMEGLSSRITFFTHFLNILERYWGLGDRLNAHRLELEPAELKELSPFSIDVFEIATLGVDEESRKRVFGYVLQGMTFLELEQLGSILRVHSLFLPHKFLHKLNVELSHSEAQQLQLQQFRVDLSQFDQGVVGSDPLPH